MGKKIFKRIIFLSSFFTLGAIGVVAANSINNATLAEETNEYVVNKAELRPAATASVHSGVHDVWEKNWTLVMSGNECIAGHASISEGLAFEFTFKEAGTISRIGEAYSNFYTASKSKVNPIVLLLHNSTEIKHSSVANPEDEFIVNYDFEAFTINANDTVTLIFDADSNSPGNNIQMNMSFGVNFLPSDASSVDYNGGNGAEYTLENYHHLSKDDSKHNVLKYYSCSYSLFDPNANTGRVYYEINYSELVYREINNNPNVRNSWEGSNNWTLIQGANTGIAGHARLGLALAFEYTIPSNGTVSDLGSWDFYAWAKSGSYIPNVKIFQNGYENEVIKYSDAGNGMLVYYGFKAFNAVEGDKITFVLDADSNPNDGENISVQFQIGFNFTSLSGESKQYRTDKDYYTTDTTNSSFLKYYEVSYSKPDHEPITTLVSEAAKLENDANLYTEDSFATFINAYNKAKDAVEDYSLSTSELTTIYDALDNAMKGLVLAQQEESSVVEESSEEQSSIIEESSEEQSSIIEESSEVILSSVEEVSSEDATSSIEEVSSSEDVTSSVEIESSEEEQSSIIEKSSEEQSSILEESSIFETSSESHVEESSQTHEDEPTKGGCGGSIVATSAIVSILAVAGLVIIKHRKENK